MVDQLSSYRKYVRRIRGLLLFTGLWPSRKWAGSAYRFIPFINGIVCFSLSCAVLSFCGDQFNNLELLTKGFGIVGSYWTAVLKVLCFRINHKELVDLHRTLEKYFEESLSNDKIRKQIFDPLTIFVVPFYALTILLFISTLAFFIAPVILVCVQLSNGIYPVKYLLPNPGKYPYSFEGGSLVYYVHYAWQMLAATYLLCLTSGVDSLFGYYVFQMHAIFQLMNHRMNNLGLADQDNGSIVRECVKMYQMLAKCRDHLQLIYGPIVFWIFLTSAIILCSQIFQASQTGQLTVGRAVLFVTYFALKLLQALMYAWYGSVIVTEVGKLKKLILFFCPIKQRFWSLVFCSEILFANEKQSEKFRDAVYCCDWPGSGDKSLMNDVLIMMCNKPLGITACKFLIISTNMFTTIINTTMSYFFLLQTLDEAN
uniref:Odorant receptor n=1 Tax=Campoletis chlorideae TaxID=219166 RepID=A0A346D3W6_9HYME|nr:odorant receptor [Campoletis chlorideae]